MNSNPMVSKERLIGSRNKDSWVHRWEPRTKLVTAIIMTFMLVTLQTPKLLIYAYFAMLMVLISMGFSLKVIMKRNMYILPFLIFMSVPLLIGGGLPPSQERITLVLLLAFKSWTALYIMFMVFSSQPTAELLNGLAYMRLPEFFISIVFLSWRYVFLLGDKFSTMYKALISRLFKPSVGKDSLKIYGQVMGGMLIKSLDTSDKVYKAMVSRGFDGTIPTSRPREIKAMDLLKSLLMISTVLLLIFIEKWWY